MADRSGATTTPDDPGWLRRLGGPTFVIVLASMVLLALHGRGVLPRFDAQVLAYIVLPFIGGEKAAKAVGRYVAKKRW